MLQLIQIAIKYGNHYTTEIMDFACITEKINTLIKSSNHITQGNTTLNTLWKALYIKLSQVKLHSRGFFHQCIA